MALAHCRPNRADRPADRRGAAAVEFALTAPILVLMLFASLDIGRMNMIRQTAKNAAYEAARRCVVPGGNVADGEAAGRAVLNAIGVRNYSVDVQPDPILNTTPTVTATVAVPFSGNMWSQPLFSKSGSVTAVCQMARDWTVSTRQSQ